MYNEDTELLFPLRVIPVLRNLRSEIWAGLIDQVGAPTADPLDQQAFTLMMVRLASCTSCGADSFRAMRGCTQCARQTVRRFRGSDADLLVQFQQYRIEVQHYLQKQAA
ncbi:MAG TPA: hypothetical protein PKG95_01395 [Anaerolineaceae bacterium]|jgi:hypothetical protein|nr:hypothetical protein [Anaerolineaceae bacterium]